MKTVLIVDDSAFMRSIIKNILSGHGFQVIDEAENGRIGVEKYKALKPDIVTMDTNMNVMNGLEALKAIKAYDRKANVIMVSSMGQEPIVKEAITLGAKGFVVKPFEVKQMVEALSAV
jgi:two-component system chemotaxis response regulator CheY